MKLSCYLTQIYTSEKLHNLNQVSRFNSFLTIYSMKEMNFRVHHDNIDL